MTVRAFARERLAEAGEATTVARRHRDHFLALAGRLAPNMVGAGLADVAAARPARARELPGRVALVARARRQRAGVRARRPAVDVLVPRGVHQRRPRAARARAARRRPRRRPPAARSRRPRHARARGGRARRARAGRRGRRRMRGGRRVRAARVRARLASALADRRGQAPGGAHDARTHTRARRGRRFRRGGGLRRSAARRAAARGGRPRRRRRPAGPRARSLPHASVRRSMPATRSSISRACGSSQGRPREALEVAGDALADFRRREDPRGLAAAFVCLGRAYALLGEHGRARPPLDEALALARRWGLQSLAEAAARALNAAPSGHVDDAVARR